MGKAMKQLQKQQASIGRMVPGVLDVSAKLSMIQVCLFPELKVKVIFFFPF